MVLGSRLGFRVIQASCAVIIRFWVQGLGVGLFRPLVLSSFGSGFRVYGLGLFRPLVLSSYGFIAGIKGPAVDAKIVHVPLLLHSTTTSSSSISYSISSSSSSFSSSSSSSDPFRDTVSLRAGGLLCQRQSVEGYCACTPLVPDLHAALTIAECAHRHHGLNLQHGLQAPQTAAVQGVGADHRRCGAAVEAEQEGSMGEAVLLDSHAETS